MRIIINVGMVVVIIQRIMATTFLEERPVVRWYLQKVLETVFIDFWAIISFAVIADGFDY